MLPRFDQIEKLATIGAGWRQSDPIHLFAQEYLEVRRFHFRGLIAVGQQQAISRVSQHIFEGFGDGCMDRVEDIRDHEADGIGSLGCQTSRDGVGLIAELFNGLQHAGASLNRHGARAVVYRVKDASSRRALWLKQLIERRGVNRATVALANKMARVAWVLLARGGVYRAA